MTGQPSAIRRLYDAVAMFALLNMLLLAGLVAYFFFTGAVDGSKLRQVGMVLRGLPLTATKPSAVADSRPASASPSAVAPPIETEADVEIAYREAERIKTELEQRLALSNSILLKVRTEREAFQKERQAALQREQAGKDVAREEGFRKQVAILEALSPKVAVQHLLSMADPDEAAKVLTAMDTGRAKKIIESAKRGDEAAQMKTILQRIREVAPTHLADLNRNEE